MAHASAAQAQAQAQAQARRSLSRLRRAATASRGPLNADVMCRSRKRG
jgi:hypothetical protein